MADSNIACPQATAVTLVNGAALTDGYAPALAAAKEAETDRHYAGRFNGSRWRLEAVIQEVYGRMGRRSIA